jgi:hypothetical protein
VFGSFFVGGDPTTESSLYGCGTPMIFRDCGLGQLLDQIAAKDFDAL